MGGEQDTEGKDMGKCPGEGLEHGAGTVRPLHVFTSRRSFLLPLSSPFSCNKSYTQHGALSPQSCPSPFLNVLPISPGTPTRNPLPRLPGPGSAAGSSAVCQGRVQHWGSPESLGWQGLQGESGVRVGGGQHCANYTPAQKDTSRRLSLRGHPLLSHTPLHPTQSHPPGHLGCGVCP